MVHDMDRVQIFEVDDRQALGDLDILDGQGARRVPLMAMLSPAVDGRLTFDVVVGEVAVLASDDGDVEYHVWPGLAWSVVDSVLGNERTGHGFPAADLARAVGDLLPRRTPDEDGEHTAARHAKALAELARNNADTLRELRYHWENELARESEQGVSSEHTAIVSSILKLHVLCGRVRDLGDNAVREGLYLWLTDSDAYNAYRRRREPDLLLEAAPATVDTRPWMRLHDAGIRQCERMAEAARGEAESLTALLGAASSTAESREADAQTRLNQLVGLLSIGLGVPALVLTLYGAQILLPLSTGRQWFAFLPVAISLLVAGVLAIVFAPTGRTRRVWQISGACVVLVLAILVVGAVTIGPA